MKIDRVHFYLKDAVKTKDWFVRNLGFKTVADYDDEHTHTEVVAANSACLVFSSPLTNNSPVANYLNSHPSGVADIVFRVRDIQSIIDRVWDLGLKILQPLQVFQSPWGEFKQIQIQGWESLQHTLIEETVNKDATAKESITLTDSQITDIDHIVLNVPAGKLNSAVKLYQTLFGFKVQQSFNIKTKTSGLYSKALIDDSGEVQFNINEPTSSNSQIQEFLDFNNGSGIQHLALRSQNLLDDVARMQQNNVPFLRIPQTYYDRLDKTLNLTLHEWQAIAKNHILVDGNPVMNDGASHKSDRSLLMQIFTQPIFEKPTFFLEFIERRERARGFGQGNFKELFAAVEREQINS